MALNDCNLLSDSFLRAYQTMDIKQLFQSKLAVRKKGGFISLALASLIQSVVVILQGSVCNSCTFLNNIQRFLARVFLL